jgi:hypothetical protein
VTAKVVEKSGGSINEALVKWIFNLIKLGISKSNFIHDNSEVENKKYSN